MRLVLLLLLIPTVAGHGAPDAREIDVRALVDGTENYDYGTATEGDPRPLYEGGHDLLALDLREGFDAARGGHLLMWRLVMQFGDPTLGELSEDVMFTINGTEHTITISSSDNEDFEVAGADGYVVLNIGDEHVRGVEFWTTMDTLGAAIGDTITDLRVAGYVDDRPADVMPGTYHLGGQMVPGETGTPGTWELAGPAALFTITIEGPWTMENGTGKASLLVESPLNAMGQFVTVALDVEGNATAADAKSINLDPKGARRMTFSIDGAAPGDTVVVTATSDLDALAAERVVLDVPFPPLPPPPTSEPAAKESPFPTPLILLALLGAGYCRKH